MKKEYTVNGYTFELNEHGQYECKGVICHDDEHDETPEPGLWMAAHKLAEQLTDEDEVESTEVNHSEKGWVEVEITKKV